MMHFVEKQAFDVRNFILVRGLTLTKKFEARNAFLGGQEIEDCCGRLC